MKKINYLLGLVFLMMLIFTVKGALAHIVPVQNQINVTINADKSAFVVYSVGQTPITYSIVANVTYYHTNIFNATYQYGTNATINCNTDINESLRSINNSIINSISGINLTNTEQYFNNQLAQQFKSQQDWITNSFIPLTNDTNNCYADLKIANEKILGQEKTIISKDEVANIKNEEITLIKQDNKSKTYVSIALMSMLIIMALLMSGSVLWGRFKYS